MNAVGSSLKHTNQFFGLSTRGTGVNDQVSTSNVPTLVNTYCDGHARCSG